MKEFEIWSEGYLCSGMEGVSAKAHYHTTIEANTFEEGIKLFAKRDPSFARYLRKDAAANLYTYWGCRLYASQELASKSFG